MNYWKISTIIYVVVLLTAISCNKKELNEGDDLPATSLESQNNQRLKWFQEAKFGMFIHWGLYAVPAGEWNGNTNYAEWIMLHGDIPIDTYKNYAGQFNPTRFNAEEWATLAKDAGMKYLVITAKHHDGFSMYESNFTDYDIIDATPFKRDPLQELAEACRKVGIKFCVYYSMVDWYHPEFPARYSQIRKNFPSGYHGRPNENADIKKYNEFMRNQVKELLTNHGDVGIVWFDGGGSFRNYDRVQILEAKRMVDMIHELQPNTLINNRLGYGTDYVTPEQYIPDGPQASAFEVCMTLNKHWGYNKNDHDWKDAKTIITNISDIATKGGNYLLNVGPTAEGLIPDSSVNILKQVGEWMKVNGEAIYGTTGAPPRDNMRFAGTKMTQKPGKLYLHVFNWPDDQKLFVEGMKGDITRKVYLLSDPDKTPLVFDAKERSVTISVPAEAPDKVCSIVVLEYEGTLLD